MWCCDALKALIQNLSLLDDLSDLPSYYVVANRNENKKRDTEVGQIVKSWDAKRVRVIVQCFYCGKSQCMYTATDVTYASAMTAIQQKLESMSYQILCSDLLLMIVTG